MERFRRAYLSGDLFPVWTPFPANGHGSPTLFLYHRLYASTFALLAIATGTLWAFRLSVPLLLVAGGLGVYRLCRGFGVRRSVAFVASALFVWAPYSLTNWLVRGAMAEFTAMMVVPWVLHGCAQLAARRAAPWRLAVPLVFLFFAHTVIFMWTVPFLVATLVEAAVRTRPLTREGIARVLRDAAVTVGLASLVIGPYVLGMFSVTRYFSLDMMGRVEPSPLTSFVYDPDYTLAGTPSWGIGLSLGWVLLPLMVAGFVAGWGGRPASVRNVLFLVIPSLVYLTLESEKFAWFFRAIPGGDMIQFPFRLATFLAPTALVTMAIVVEDALAWSRAPGRGLVLAALGGATVGSLAFATLEQTTALEHAWPRDVVDGMVTRADLMNREYLPNGALETSRRPFLDAPVGCTVQLDDEPPTARVVAPRVFRRLDLVIRSATPCLVTFSQYRSPLLAIRVPEGGQVMRDREGMTTLLVPAGEQRVTIRERTLLELAWVGLRELRART